MAEESGNSIKVSHMGQGPKLLESLGCLPGSASAVSWCQKPEPGIKSRQSGDVGIHHPPVKPVPMRHSQEEMELTRLKFLCP